MTQDALPEASAERVEKLIAEVYGPTPKSELMRGLAPLKLIEGLPKSQHRGSRRLLALLQRDLETIAKLKRTTEHSAAD